MVKFADCPEGIPCEAPELPISRVWIQGVEGCLAAPLLSILYIDSGSASFACLSRRLTVARETRWVFAMLIRLSPRLRSRRTATRSTSIGRRPICLPSNLARRITVPPMQQPGPGQVDRIRKEDLRTSPRSSINNDLHLIVITFPDNIDPASFDGGPGAHSATNLAKPSSTSIFPI